MDAFDRFTRTIRERGLFERGDSLLLALSGGADSVSLLHLLARIRDAWSLRLSALHVNHGLRGAESDEDERFAREECGRLGVPFRSVRIDLGGADGEAGLSLQDRARGLRAGALLRAMKKDGADRIATGHNRDDRAETVLYHLFRGSGPRGLAGISYRSGPFVRPLLDLPRAAIEEWLRREGITFREDRTNRETKYDRNRIRLELIPAAERLLGRSVAGPIVRSAEILAEADDFLRREAERWIENRREPSRAGETTVPAEALAEEHPALASEIVRTMAARGAGGEGTRIRRAACRRLLAFAAAGREGSLRIPGGLEARIEEGLFFIEIPLSAPEPYERRVEIGRPLLLPGGDILLCRAAGADEKNEEAWIPEGALIARLDADRTAPPYRARNRRAGDRFHPLGSPGKRKLQDLFTDRKIPRRRRDAIPLFLDEEGILWAAGVEIAERAKVTRSSARILTVAILPAPNDT